MDQREIVIGVLGFENQMHCVQLLVTALTYTHMHPPPQIF